MYFDESKISKSFKLVTLAVYLHPPVCWYTVVLLLNYFNIEGRRERLLSLNEINGLKEV